MTVRSWSGTSRRAWSRRLVLGVLGAALLLVGAAAPAAAHNVLTGTTPTDTASVARTPAQVVLTFNEPAIAMGTQLVVTGPSGAVQQGPPVLVDNTVTQPIEPGAPAGAYTVTWRVTSADGHPITGSFVFTAAAAGAGTLPTAPPATPTPTPAPPSGGSGWVGWVAGLVVLASAVTIIWQVRRRAIG